MPEIRRIGEADREAWLRLRLKLWPGGDEARFDNEITDLLTAEETAPAFGAFEGGRLIGFAEAAERPWGDGCETAPVGWLEGIFIEPGFRRSGIARALVAAVVDWATGRGYSELGSDAAMDNIASRRSHAAWGFEETKHVVNFRRVLR